MARQHPMHNKCQIVLLQTVLPVADYYYLTFPHPLFLEKPLPISLPPSFNFADKTTYHLRGRRIRILRI